jgi:hypothetical protein
MIVQQFPYPEETAAEIRRSVRAGRVVGALSLALAGLPLQDAFLRQFGIRHVYVPNRRLFDFLVERRNARETYRDVEVVQVGLPYAKHPVFPEFKADWIIAAPTAFSFKKEVHKHAFFDAVLRLLEAIPPSELVAYKAHNGTARDYFTPRAYATPGVLLALVPGASRAVATLMRTAPARVRLHLERLYTSVLHARVIRRAVPMGKLTPYSDFSLEMFLPNVRRGVIGGLSNTIWGTLYFGLPFYNCVNEDERSRSERNELLPRKDSSNYLDLNLEFFSVPYCQGDISRSAHGETIVRECDREGDLVSAIRSAVAAAASS